ncbi:MAG: BamA/TamA family outer membrane protein [Saprospiraceae bacterium]|nr:BamA/TamA family outer membrane protein [Saprospiraceae bacterium]
MQKKMNRLLFVLLLVFVLPAAAFAQTDEDLPVYQFGEPIEFEIGGITVTGATYSEEVAIIGVSGLKVGDKIRIPGPEIPKAMKALMRLRLFTNVQIVLDKTIGDVVFLEIQLQERPRLSRYTYRNVAKTYHESLNEQVNKFLLKGGIVTEDVKVNSQRAIEKFFIEKGYFDTKVTVSEEPDTTRVNSVIVIFDADRGERIKIEEIEFVGVESVKEKKIARKLKNTKEKGRIFGSSKLVRKDYEEDKKAIVAYYNTIGHRDARVTGDTMWRDEEGRIRLRINIDEGNRYYFRNIAWKGNSIYDTETLERVLGIEKGEIYNQELLEKRLRFSQDGSDVSTLYMDNGYLFFNVDPVEVAIDGDSIDLEMRIFEGPQATIDKVVIKGNDRTHEHVIRRELFTKPGEKFSRSDILRSQRQIVNLGYFNPEALDINTPVNPQRGTVDIEYTVEEKPSDQLELSAGWGGIQRVIGTLGVSFNNFSLRNIFNKEAWRPLPQGDGQRLSLRAQTNGNFYQSYNISLTDPWLGGKKPNSFTVSGFYNKFSGFNRNQNLSILQGSASLGTRLKWPDDNFVSTTALNLQSLQLNDWSAGAIGSFTDDAGNNINNGKFNNFSIRQTLARSTVYDPIFPREGSRVSLSVQFTLPYSLFNNKDYSELSPEERYRWLEYHKWRFDAEWYTPIVGKLVLKTSAKIGLVGFYNREIGTTPFERFQVGGDGINNQQFGFQGVDIISMRGYEVTDLSANFDALGRTSPAPVFDKFTVEMRYPLSLNPSSTIYVLAFAQGGNAWRNLRDFNPFDLKRSAGVGMRVFLPMFGMLGFDYGIGFDKVRDPGARGLKGLGDFNIVLGFEPE